MPQLLSGGGSQSASGLVEAAAAGVSSGAGSASSSSSSRASSQGSAASQRFRAVVAISSDEDRDRIFYEDDDDSPQYQYYRPEPLLQGPAKHAGTVASDVGGREPGPGVVGGRGPVDCPPPPPPPKPPSRPLAAKPHPKPPAKLPKTVKKKKDSPPTTPSGGKNGVDAMTSVAMPDAAARWGGPDGSVPKVVAHENGAIVNGYLLVNGTDSLHLPDVLDNTGSGPPKRYHVTGMLTNGNHDNDDNKQVVEESTFAGSRDVKDPDTLRDRKIVSAKGTIRGVKNRVRAGIATFLENQELAKNYRGAEKGKIVVYVTSMRIIRQTYERCQKARRILQTHMVCYEEVDIFMSKENQRALMERLGADSIVVPQVFADGQHLGGVEELDYMNESGELRQIFQNFKKVQRTTSCSKCGGYRFVNCPSCHGSKKSLNRNHFTEEFCALRCVNCDENGLVRCDSCVDEDPEKK